MDQVVAPALTLTSKILAMDKVRDNGHENGTNIKGKTNGHATNI